MSFQIYMCRVYNVSNNDIQVCVHRCMHVQACIYVSAQQVCLHFVWNEDMSVNLSKSCLTPLPPKKIIITFISMQPLSVCPLVSRKSIGILFTNKFDHILPTASSYGVFCFWWWKVPVQLLLRVVHVLCIDIPLQHPLVSVKSKLESLCSNHTMYFELTSLCNIP